MNITLTEDGKEIFACPDCTSPMVGVDNRWVCRGGQHTRMMEPLDEAIAEERLEWTRFEAVLDQMIAEDTSHDLKHALADQLVEHLKRGKYLAWVISQQGGDYYGGWWV